MNFYHNTTWNMLDHFEAEDPVMTRQPVLRQSQVEVTNYTIRRLLDERTTVVGIILQHLFNRRQLTHFINLCKYMRASQRPRPPPPGARQDIVTKALQLSSIKQKRHR